MRREKEEETEAHDEEDGKVREALLGVTIKVMRKMRSGYRRSSRRTEGEEEERL